MQEYHNSSILKLRLSNKGPPIYDVRHFFGIFDPPPPSIFDILARRLRDECDEYFKNILELRYSYMVASICLL